MMLIAIESSCMSVSAHSTAAAAPADLHGLPILQQHRYGRLPAGRRVHSRQGLGIGFHVVFAEFPALPVQPFPHFLSVRTRRGAEQLSFRHETSLTVRKWCDKPRPALPVSVECNRTA